MVIPSSRTGSKRTTRRSAERTKNRLGNTLDKNTDNESKVNEKHDFTDSLIKRIILLVQIFKNTELEAAKAGVDNIRDDLTKSVKNQHLLGDLNQGLKNCLDESVWLTVRNRDLG